MHDADIFSLLQEIAIELAFLMPSKIPDMSHLTELLGCLLETSATQSSPAAQEDVAWLTSVCQMAMMNQAALSKADLESIHACFERLSNALYFLPPLTSEALGGPTTLSSKERMSSVGSQTPDSALMLDGEGILVLGPDADQELLNEFCNEGIDLLQRVEQGVLVLEDNPKDATTLNQIFRAFHTFKGGAGFLGLTPIQHLAHELESLLDAARQGQLQINRGVIDLILAGGDALMRYVKAIDVQLQGQGKGQAIMVPTSALISRAQACLKARSSSSGPVLTKAASLAVAVKAPIKPGNLNLSAVEHANCGEREQSSVALGTKNTASHQTALRNESLVDYVKLDTRKLDALVDFVGELVIAQSMVVQHPLVLAPRDRDLERHLHQLSRITTDLQRNAMSLRMVSVRSVMEKMTRLVRDLASCQNKQIQLHLSGEDTELDRKVVEQMADPLLHMMRNAVDHGIELPAEREGQGKSAQGNIHLQATHQGGGILICIRDDGKGLDSEKILSKAVARGLVAKNSVLSDKEIYNLIFSPGFSTADSVTEISGRGVGMDVVRCSIHKLRGRVDIDSVSGQGTTFNIFLPLTMAIIDAMLVGVGSERFIVPSLVVRESLRPEPGMVSVVQGRGEVIGVRGKLIPLVRLADKLDLPCVAKQPCDGIVVVVDSGGRSRALLVDSLIGKQEVVIKPLGETFKHQKGMSGAAILGDGRVALIIDPDAIGQWPSMAPFAA